VVCPGADGPALRGQIRAVRITGTDKGTLAGAIAE